MRYVTFTMKNGKPIHVIADKIDWWLESVDNSNHTEIQVNGGKLYLGETFADVTKKVEEV